MGVTTYGNFGGRIISETQGGIEHDYLRDTLRSTVMLVDDSGVATDTFTYWPYGEGRTRTGSTETPFRFCGTIGYFRDSTERMYVRARSYNPTVGSWTVRDLIWPREPAYVYSNGRPHQRTDWTGLASSCIDCAQDPCGWALENNNKNLPPEKQLGPGPGTEGRVACCNGKPTVCVWTYPRSPAVTQCATEHEKVHIGQRSCEGQPNGFLPSPEREKDECYAYRLSISCLDGKCDSDPFGEYCEDNLCGACAWADLFCSLTRKPRIEIPWYIKEICKAHGCEKGW